MATPLPFRPRAPKPARQGIDPATIKNPPPKEPKPLKSPFPLPWRGSSGMMQRQTAPGPDSFARNAITNIKEVADYPTGPEETLSGGVPDRLRKLPTMDPTKKRRLNMLDPR